MYSDYALKVLLAVNSPIYAPIVLAKALDRGAKDVTLHLAAPPRMRESDRSGDHELVDPLVEQCLSRTETLQSPVIGVGDPMRLMIKGHARMSKPVVLGSLITKMCYWIIHIRGDRRHFRDEWDQQFEVAMTHPLGMTGYTVPFYELHQMLKRPDPRNKLYAREIDSSREVPVFEGLRSLWKKHASQTRLPPALVTTNPYHAAVAGQGTSRFDVAQAYARKPIFDDVVMTALFVAADTYQSNDQIAAVDRFVRAVARAIRIIYFDPAYSASMIWDAFYQNPRLIEYAKPYFGLPSPKVLDTCLRTLNNLNTDDHQDTKDGNLPSTSDGPGVYNTDAQLRAKPTSIDNTIAMRLALEAAMPEAVPASGAEEVRGLLDGISLKEAA